METTYQHLTDDDHIKMAEVATGIREEKAESPLTPQTCPTCSEQLKPSAKACPGCGTVFAPDAADVQKQIQQDIGAAKVLVDGVDGLTEEDIEEIANDDPLIAKLIEVRMGK